MPAILTAVMIFIGTAGVASAEDAVAVNINANVNVGVKTGSGASATASTTASTTAHATSTNTKAEGQLNAEIYRSDVASFVKSLTGVANRQGGIGAQVRIIAQAQNDSASTTATAMTKVESRGKLRTLFFGSDYKNLGQLRSEIVVTQNNIDQLKDLIAQTTNTTDKAELEAQVKVLEASQVKIQAFIKAHESSFSLFGWLRAGSK